MKKGVAEIMQYQMITGVRKCVNSEKLRGTEMTGGVWCVADMTIDI